MKFLPFSKRNSLNEQLNSVKKSCEEYKHRYALKSSESLENEKKLIQTKAKLERLKIDMSYIEERNHDLADKLDEAIDENKRIKVENERLHEQLRQSMLAQTGRERDQKIEAESKSDLDTADQITISIESLRSDRILKFQAERNALDQKIANLKCASS